MTVLSFGRSSCEERGRSPFLISSSLVRLPVNNFVHLDLVRITDLLNNANVRQLLRFVVEPVRRVIGNSNLLGKFVGRNAQFVHQLTDLISQRHGSFHFLITSCDYEAFILNITRRLQDFQSKCNILDERSLTSFVIKASAVKPEKLPALAILIVLVTHRLRTFKIMTFKAALLSATPSTGFDLSSLLDRLSQIEQTSDPVNRLLQYQNLAGQAGVSVSQLRHLSATHGGQQ